MKTEAPPAGVAAAPTATDARAPAVAPTGVKPEQVDAQPATAAAPNATHVTAQDTMADAAPPKQEDTATPIVAPVVVKPEQMYAVPAAAVVPQAAQAAVAPLGVKPEQRNAQPATAAAPQATTPTTMAAAAPPKQEESTAQPAQQGEAAAHQGADMRASAVAPMGIKPEQMKAGPATAAAPQATVAAVASPMQTGHAAPPPLQGGAAVGPPTQTPLVQQGGAAAAPPTQADGTAPPAQQGGAAVAPKKRKRSATAPEEISRVYERLKRKAVRLSASCLAAYQHNYAVPEPKEVRALNCLCPHVAVFTFRWAQALRHAEEYYRCLAMAAVVKGVVMPPQVECLYEQHQKFVLDMSEFRKVLFRDALLKTFEVGPGVGDERSARYEHTQALYLAAFGAAPNKQLWPSSNADGEVPCTLVPTAELRRLRKADEKLRRMGQGEPVLSAPEKRIKPDPKTDLPPPRQPPPFRGARIAPAQPTAKQIRHREMVRQIEEGMEGSKRLRGAGER